MKRDVPDADVGAEFRVPGQVRRDIRDGCGAGALIGEGCEEASEIAFGPEVGALREDDAAVRHCDPQQLGDGGTRVGEVGEHADAEDSVEGVIVEEGSVISMGVYLGQSTKIFNRMTGEITYGRIPAGSVVVSGNLPSKDGTYSLYCAVIVKQVDEKTRGKVGLNELLRDID